MKLATRVTSFSVERPRWVLAVMFLTAGVMALLAAVPSIWPEAAPFLNGVQVDTDPENMLSKDEAVRVFHDDMKHILSLNDIVVVGVVDEHHPNGVFTPQTLRNVLTLTEYALTLRGAALGEEDPKAGVVEIDVIAPSLVDNIEQGGMGSVRFEWLMPEPPATEEAALAVRAKAERLPFLNGTLISEDGKALALYLPLTSKDLSYRVSAKLREKIETFEGDEEYYITGLPVAEDTFGVEMFIQMGISAPLAMLVIFLLLILFFRKLALIISPLLIALVSVIITMGLLVATGNTIHIMSSMIPIFIMPIAVLDSVHILSEFFDRYQQTRDRKKTIMQVMDHLFGPMLFTSMTSAAGFASLALTPIPPVQVFGLFIAFGVLLAWILTITFIPAYVMLLPERTFKNFGAAVREESAPAEGRLAGMLHWMGGFTFAHAKLVLMLSIVAVLISGYGMSLIRINDNPTRWFKPSHPIRVSDKVLNEHFGGTYMAYLSLRAPEGIMDTRAYADQLAARLKSQSEEIAGASPEISAALPVLLEAIPARLETSASPEALLDALIEFAASQEGKAEGDLAYGWEEIAFLLDEEGQRSEIFKQPEALRYIEGLQAHLSRSDTVGKSNSIADIVKTVHRELFEGKDEAYRVPDTNRAVAQCLITFEGSHRPHDLYHFVTPDYTQTSIWVQLKSGDNIDMAGVVASMDEYVAENPPPFGLEHAWFGLTYINVVWQDKMVSGMFQAFMGSFLVVLLMMVFLFRSGLWGIISMIPLLITIGLIYGAIGYVGKDYDMPVAVLSSMTLGLAVDFAIHFLARARALHDQHGSWEAAHRHAFGEPARAILRNVIVIAVGFLPLLAAPLIPYKTVGFLLAAILLVSGSGTLLILPALLRYLEPLLFPKTRACSILCQCGTCVLFSAAAVALVVINVHQFLTVGWTSLTWISLVLLPLFALGCYGMSRREQCKENPNENPPCHNE
jgi:uncharacterized protein